MIGRKGVSLIEVLLGLLIVTIASIATLTYFSAGFGSVNKTGNRRAALEQARQRLEELMQTNPDALPASNPLLPQNAQPQLWLTCTGAPCTWASSTAITPETFTLNGVANLREETTLQWTDDPSAGTTTPDVLALGVKVWFIPNSSVDDDFNRVYVRTLRTTP